MGYTNNFFFRWFLDNLFQYNQVLTGLYYIFVFFLKFKPNKFHQLGKSYKRDGKEREREREREGKVGHGKCAVPTRFFLAYLNMNWIRIRRRRREKRRVDEEYKREREREREREGIICRRRDGSSIPKKTKKE